MSNPPKMVKLSEWAELNGINYQTAFRWFKAGKLPAKAIQTDTRTILVEVEDYDTSFDKAEATMSNDELPLSTRLHAAYKYIQKQKNERPEDIVDKKLGEQYGDVINSEDVTSKEKQEILKTMCGGYKPFEKIDSLTELPNEIIVLQEERKQCIHSGNFERSNELISIINEKKNSFYKEERFNILHKEQLNMREDIDIIKKDVEELLSNVFGEGKTLMDRIEARTNRAIEKALSKKYFEQLKTATDRDTIHIDLDNVTQEQAMTYIEKLNKKFKKGI